MLTPGLRANLGYQLVRALLERALASTRRIRMCPQALSFCIVGVQCPRLSMELLIWLAHTALAA